MLSRDNGGSAAGTPFRRGSKVLLVIAHPDDEAMFFSPILLRLAALGCSVAILCLSTGNYDGLGKIRTSELFASALNYRIGREQTYIFDDPRLQDGMESIWPVDLISDKVTEFCLRDDFQVIITFDEQGVSGHPNHISTYRGVAMALSEMNLNSFSNNPIGYKLQSTNVLRKFLGVFDIPISYVWNQRLKKTVVFFNLNICSVFRGMLAHWSQFVWYRFLFILFSRFSYVNTFSRI